VPHRYAAEGDLLQLGSCGGLDNYPDPGSYALHSMSPFSALEACSARLRGHNVEAVLLSLLAEQTRMLCQEAGL
jgi:hypothetical protein